MKWLAFQGVRQSEQRMADVLGQLQTDLLESVKASGAKVRGPIHESKEKGLLKQFEFDYQQGNTTGRVRGVVKPAQMEGCWDLECFVGEILPRTYR
jgi:hypothetical protein